MPWLLCSSVVGVPTAESFTRPSDVSVEDNAKSAALAHFLVETAGAASALEEIRGNNDSLPERRDRHSSVDFKMLSRQYRRMRAKVP